METRLIPSFGRRLGRTLTAIQRELLASSPHIVKDMKKIEDAYKMGHKVIAEIGFGNGKHVLDTMCNLDRDGKSYAILGCETYVNGVAKLLVNLHKLHEEKEGIFIYNGDCRDLMQKHSEPLFSTIYILFPDPWPKTKHHKRRIVNHDNLQMFHTLLIRGGEIIFASDWSEYGEYIEKILQNDTRWSVTKHIARTESDYIALSIHTHYATKAIKNNASTTYLNIKKIS